MNTDKLNLALYKKEIISRYQSGESVAVIAKKFNCSLSAIYLRFKQWNIKTFQRKRAGDKHHTFSGYKEISGGYFGRLKREAINRNIEFNISIKDIWKLFLKQNRQCALTGQDIKFSAHNNWKKQTASLDRIDSSKNYTIDNIQWVHKDINRFKNNYKQEEFLKMCKNVYKYSIQEKEEYWA